ncbi:MULTISPECIES: GAF domain-containing protein [unclassified Colwellia]|jgi:L-methionine (R)-S-oxide reductase|uniref:GAF domain-containing protein n=1 Tax=unclassified Colwellia TaxID=196834 RepID=UPI000D3B4F06|nr:MULTISPECIES: GAF domain-containing protein [unclassified Colwellia]AWB57912.1 GAF domain-containing protein [Colwellia sp. Arc7-D]MBA6415225.1 GAF domain-containing protein [Colwellia sp. 6M3]|tara:strand:- start:1062 stop:1538 length:477 start_codon:yes stop_codon:yes gene_type:complete
MTKNTFYRDLYTQVEALISDEADVIANMANVSALLFEQLSDVNWVGFYRMVNDELVLGPFQGKVACIRIPVGRGVCGTAVSENKVQRIADVHEFDGHIACDASTNSEIVLPLTMNNKVIAVLDIDSVAFNRFDADDQVGLEKIISLFENVMISHGVLN